MLVIDGKRIYCETALRWMNVTGSYWWLVNIGSGNGLVPPGNKPFPDQMLTDFSDVICRKQWVSQVAVDLYCVFTHRHMVFFTGIGMGYKYYVMNIISKK